MILIIIIIILLNICLTSIFTLTGFVLVGQKIIINQLLNVSRSQLILVKPSSGLLSSTLTTAISYYSA